MININILPQETKKELRLRHIHAALKDIDFMLIVFGSVIGLMLLFARLIMQNDFNSIVDQTSLITRNSQSYNLRVRDINTKVNSVDQIQKDFLVWSRVFNLLSEISNDGLSFNYIKVNRDDKSIKTRGTAKTRESLLLLKEKMEASNYFNKIDFPLANILEKTDISFEINAGLELNKLNI
jgi:hypothetical protein